MLKDLEASTPSRRLLLESGLAWLLFGTPAYAQTGLTRERMDRLIQKALAKDNTTPISRPHILGFAEDRLTTKSIESGGESHKYGFMVVIPRHADGIVIFEGRQEKPIYFVMHRTDTHLKRVTSAINREGKLIGWSGAEADASFASHLSFWSRVAL